jgi:hypothetical protein
MKKIWLFASFLITSLPGFSQTYKLTWGEEMKLKKGTTDLDIITADNSGLYVTEQRVKLKSYFVIGATYGNAYKLIKLDKNFGEVYDKEYKKELKGLDFHSFQPLEEDLFMFATDYDKKAKEFVVLGSKVDKSSGDLNGDFLELGRFGLESKRDDYDMKMTSIQNGKAFLMVSNISNKDRVSLAVSVLDKTLKRKESAVINMSFNPGLYQLEDVKFTNDKKIVVMGREFEEVEYGKRKRKKLVFKQYVMSVYNNKGKKEKDVVMDAADRYIISGKLIEQPSGELLLAGFYSNTAKKEELNGFFINKLNPVEGQMTLSSFKEINAGMLGNSFEDAADEDAESKASKKAAEKAKADDEEVDFPNSYVIKSVDISPADNSIIISSEISKYSYYSYTTQSYNNATKMWSTQWHYVHSFTNRDILVINADKDGNIRWINDIPKSQVEEITSSSRSGSGIGFSYDQGSFFAQAGGMPFYSSFARLIYNNNLILLFNDHNSNNVIAEYGNKVKTISNFRKRSTAYAIAIDLATGKMTRKILGVNNEETILMPRHAYVVGDNTNNKTGEIISPSWRMHALAKTELRFAQITVR